MLSLRGHGFCLTHRALTLKTEKRRKETPEGGREKEGVLGTLASVTTHLFLPLLSRSIALPITLDFVSAPAHFLQQHFRAGVLGLCRGKTKKDMTRVNSAVTAALSPL